MTIVAGPHCLCSAVPSSVKGSSSHGGSTAMPPLRAAAAPQRSFLPNSMSSNSSRYAITRSDSCAHCTAAELAPSGLSDGWWQSASGGGGIQPEVSSSSDLYHPALLRTYGGTKVDEQAAKGLQPRVT